MIKSAFAMCLFSGIFFAGTASAQFHVPKLGGSSQSQSSDAQAAQTKLVKNFVAAQTETLTAQALLAKAYGLKSQAAACQVQINALKSSGTDKDTLKKTVDISNSANKAIAAQQATHTKLSVKGKDYYAKSLPHFVKGLVGIRKLVTESSQFLETAKSSASSSGLGGLVGGATKLKAGLFVAKAMPSYAKNLTDVVRKTVSIGKKNGVKIPDNATSALGSL